MNRALSLALSLALITPLGCHRSAAQTAKPSPSSVKLNATAKELTAEQSALNNAITQAKASEDAQEKLLSQQYIDADKSLLDQLRKDKKYAAQIAHIEDLQKQVQGVRQTAGQNFQQQSGQLSAKVQGDLASIAVLEGVVREENGWPESQKYDPATQTWSGAAQPTEKK
jgi:hypothetical protein